MRIGGSAPFTMASYFCFYWCQFVKGAQVGGEGRGRSARCRRLGGYALFVKGAQVGGRGGGARCRRLGGYALFSTASCRYPFSFVGAILQWVLSWNGGACRDGDMFGGACQDRDSDSDMFGGGSKVVFWQAVPPAAAATWVRGWFLGHTLVEIGARGGLLLAASGPSA